MNVLVIGSGGREHAIAKKMKQSPLVENVFCAKGNPRMERDGITTVAIDETDAKRLVQFAKENAVQLTFIGPEIPLFHGVSDAFEKEHLPIFSPSQAAAKIEYSKDFAKQLMQKYGIPTAKSKTFTDYEKAKQYVLKQGAPIVIKADGLAAGKGVVVAQKMGEALDALADMLLDKTYANQGEAKVVIEEYLEGEEFSLFSFVNGKVGYFAGVSQDHKRAFDGDKGPNTGGMGAYSPVPQFEQAVIDEAMTTIVKPIIHAMVSEGIPYKGVLYAGLMKTNSGVKVIEFNARFGDPETQVVLQRLDSDLVAVMLDMLNNQEPVLTWKDKGVTLGVVVAADGYPKIVAKGFVLNDLTVEDYPGELQLFASGVAGDNEQYLANGGRLFLVSSTASSVEKAREYVYAYLNQNNIEGTFYRKDIGYRALRDKEI